MRGITMIFLSSARSNEVLVEVRNELGQWADDESVDLWRFDDPKTGKEYWDKKGVAGTAAACLQKVDDCDLYVAMFHGAYGSSRDSHAASVALTDLEFFEAVSEGKKIRYYIIEPHEPEDELRALLTLVRAVAPGTFGGAGSAGHVIRLIKDEIARNFARPDLRSPWLTRGFRKYEAGLMSLRRSELDSVDGLQVLPENSLMATNCRSVDEFEQLLGSVTEIEERSERENHLTALLPELAMVPYKDPIYSPFYSVWDRYCEGWLRATAWRGHHTALRMGRLAMLNTQMAVRCSLAGLTDRQQLVAGNAPSAKIIGDPAPWIRVFNLGGALGSEYYSLAKNQRDHRRKETFLRRGLEFLHIATRVNGLIPDDERDRFFAGLAAIRGHIYLELSDKTLDPVAAFEESLKLRESTDVSLASVAEAKADLGHVMIRQGLSKRGHALLIKGVEELESQMAKGFAARAKLKLAEAFLRRGSIENAVQQVREADAICEFHKIKKRELGGTLPRLALMSLRLLGGRGPKLTVERSDSGYRYRNE